MPISPTWLKPADPADKYLEGFRSGASVAEAQARMQQQADQFAVETEIKKRQTEVAAEHQKALLETQQAYKQAQIDLQQQKLQQVKEVNDRKAMAAARQYEARQKISQVAAAGGDVSQAISQFGLDSGATGGQLGAVQRAQPAIPPKLENWEGGAQTVAQTQPGGNVSRTVIARPQASASAEAKDKAARMSYLQKNIARLTKLTQVPPIKGTTSDAYRLAYQKNKTELDNDIKEYNQLNPSRLKQEDGEEDSGASDSGGWQETGGVRYRLKK